MFMVTFFSFLFEEMHQLDKKEKPRQPYPPKNLLFPFYPLSYQLILNWFKNRWAVVDDYIDVLLHGLSLESGYTIFVDNRYTMSSGLRACYSCR